MEIDIRKLIPKDIPAIKEVIDSTQLFPSNLVDDMSRNYFNNENSTEIWLTTIENNVPIAVAYCAPERMTEGTYNLYLIAVHKKHQGKGIGSQMMKCVEELLKNIRARILIVETSGLTEYELTRKFYIQLDYKREAIIREFYQKGEDKIVFWKKLI